MLEASKFNNKKVLIRVDFNVPITDGEIRDNTRIKRALPTINKVLRNGGSVILVSHLGRPQKSLLVGGIVDKASFSLEQIVEELSHLLHRDVKFSSDCGGIVSAKMTSELKKGEVLLLENTRFYKEEKIGDHDFAKSLANLADIYINDAFGTAHRAHASTTTVAKFFDRSNKSFGLLMENELENANKVLDNPVGPFTVILGGAKVSDKIALIENLLPKADHICIGGGMAYTFIKALGGEVGNSLVEEDLIHMSKDILKKANESHTHIHLPIDSLVASEFSENATPRECISSEIPDDKMGLDIGSRAIADFRHVILDSKTIIWNGPMGVFEFSSFANGTFEVAKAVAEATDNGAYSLIGGGDSVAAINQTGLADRVSFISTGGGAMLELLEGKTLPGVAQILED